MSKLKIIVPIIAVFALVLVTFFPINIEVDDGTPRVIIGNYAWAQEADYLCDGENDHIQLQLALNELPSSGGMIYVLAGAYHFGDGETVTRNITDVSIVGLGGATTFEGDGETSIFEAGGNRWLFMNLGADCGGIALGSTEDWCLINVHNCTSHFGLLTDTAGGEMVEHGNEWHSPDFATVTALDDVITDLNSINSTVIDLDSRLDDAELDILVLQVDVLELQGNVTALWGNMSAVQGDITVLQGNVTALWGNMSAVQADITVLQGNVTALAGNISNLKPIGIIYIIDGGGSAITTGVKGFLEIPFDCSIESWSIVADQSGSVIIDVWKDTYANFPPTVADTIAGSEKPTLSTAQKNQDLSLTTWTKTVSAGDFLAFNVDSASTVTRVTLTLTANRVTE